MFAAKASRYLTHVRRLREIEQGIHRYYERIMPLVEADKLGPVVWQFPANFRNEGDALERIATTLELLPPGRHCFEFRHESWFAEPVYALLRERGAALVIGDHPKWPFQAHELTADWTLVRLHHGHRGRRGNYSESELDEWARRIARWRRRAEVFVYFNNDWEGFASRTRSRSSGGCGRLQPIQRPPQQARDVHLRIADLLADLALRQVVHEAQLQDLALHLW